MVYDGAGGLFIVSRGHLRHVTRDNKDGEMWSGGWVPESMVYDGAGGLFIVSRGHLRHVTPGTHELPAMPSVLVHRLAQDELAQRARFGASPALIVGGTAIAVACVSVASLLRRLR